MMFTKGLFFHRLSFKSLALVLCLLDGTTSSVSPGVPYDQRYIVEIDPTKADSLSDFCHHLNSLNVTHSVVHDYTSIAPDAFYGASLRLHHPGHLETLAGADAVKSVTPVSLLKPINPVSAQIIKRPLATAKNPNAYAPLVQTRVSDLHAKGIYGQGIKVALIDSGVDCSHPALGNGFGPGHKIGFGYDLVGDEYNGANQPVPRPNPCTPCGLHGTHTSGIVGANDVGFGFQGVAPNATLGMYRVMGCQSEGGSSNEIVISALLMAIRDGADVISASIGGVGGWSKGDALSDLINVIVGRGIALIMAAGNEGSEGMFFAESPAAADNAIAIGSVESNTEIVSKFTTSNGRSIPYFTGGIFNGSNFRVYATSPTSAVQDDACKPLAASTPNLSGYVVLIRRGECTYAHKAQNAILKGASRILFYMNSTENATLPNYIDSAQVATIPRDDGEWLLKQIHTNPALTVSFPRALHEYVATPRGGFVSNYSQYGPSYDFKNLQPNFLGVGGNIVSTVPLKSGGFSSMSGTSMATPQIAGIAALVKSVRGKTLHAGRLRQILTTTAQQVPIARGQEDVDTVIHQGGGLVDAYCAALAHTTLSTDALALNDLHFFKSRHTFNITNDGNESYSFNVGHIPAVTVPTFRPGSHLVSTTVTPVPGSPSAGVQVNPATFTLGPKASQTIQVDFTAPGGLDPALLAVYSGYIAVISNADCEKHTLPYYGVAGVMKDTKIIDHGHDTGNFTNIILPRITDAQRKPRLNNVFTFQPEDTIVVRYRLAFGTAYVRMDLISANATLNRQFPSRTEAMSSMPDIGKNFTLPEGTFQGAKLFGMLLNSNSTYAGRTGVEDTVVQPWDGTVIPPDNQSRTISVPNGIYSILVRALRVDGNPLNDDDYDIWVSPSITVQRPPSAMGQPYKPVLASKTP